MTYRDNFEFITKALSDRLQDAANALCYAPRQQHDEVVERMRSFVEQKYTELYEKGHIPCTPIVTAQYDPETGKVDFNIEWSITTVTCLIRGSDDTENSAIDAPSENP